MSEPRTYTLQEEFSLPSQGKIYGRNDINFKGRIRSYTVADEQLILGAMDNEYEFLCQLLDECIIDPIGIPAYDLQLGDYNYLLHKLRIATYGAECLGHSNCPYCRHHNIRKVNLDDLQILPLPDDYFEGLTVTLPVKGDVVDVRFLTPRDMDEIQAEIRAYKKENPESKRDMGKLYQIVHSIAKVNGRALNKIALTEYIERLVMVDSKTVEKAISNANDRVGLDLKVANVCTNPKCEQVYIAPFRYGQDFFNPTL